MTRRGRHRHSQHDALRAFCIRRDLDPQVLTVVVNAKHVHDPVMVIVSDAL
jgi:hypothetical protein